MILRTISLLLAVVFLSGILSGCSRHYKVEHVEIKKHPIYTNEPGNSEFGHSHKKKKKEHDDD